MGSTTAMERTAVTRMAGPNFGSRLEVLTTRAYWRTVGELLSRVDGTLIVNRLFRKASCCAGT
jgi:hypothetical protein